MKNLFPVLFEKYLLLRKKWDPFFNYEGRMGRMSFFWSSLLIFSLEFCVIGVLAVFTIFGDGSIGSFFDFFNKWDTASGKNASESLFTLTGCQVCQWSILLPLLSPLCLGLLGTTFSLWMGIPIVICCCFVYSVPVVKRLHDLKIAGWMYLALLLRPIYGLVSHLLEERWTIWFIVTVISTVMFIFLFFKRGTVGANAYGPDPLGVDKHKIA